MVSVVLRSVCGFGVAFRLGLGCGIVLDGILRVGVCRCGGLIVVLRVVIRLRVGRLAFIDGVDHGQVDSCRNRRTRWRTWHAVR